MKMLKRILEFRGRAKLFPGAVGGDTDKLAALARRELTWASCQGQRVRKWQNP